RIPNQVRVVFVGCVAINPGLHQSAVALARAASKTSQEIYERHNCAGRRHRQLGFGLKCPCCSAGKNARFDASPWPKSISNQYKTKSTPVEWIAAWTRPARLTAS